MRRQYALVWLIVASSSLIVLWNILIFTDEIIHDHITTVVYNKDDLGSPPPVLLKPPQYSNDYESFTTQCIKHCVSVSYKPTTPAQKKVILHYIFLSKNAKPVVFRWIDYFAIRSAYLRLRLDEIHIHTNVKPPRDSIIYNLISRMIHTLHIFTPKTEIYGNPVSVLAHQSDIKRLEILNSSDSTSSNIYFDIDIIALRPFTSEMLYPTSGVVVGWENANVPAICNAVIVGFRKLDFIKRWLESYKTFDDSIWNYHSVKLPGKMSRLYPNDVTVLPRTAFFYPSWTPDDLRMLFDVKSSVYDVDLFEFKKAFVHESFYRRKCFWERKSINSKS